MLSMQSAHALGPAGAILARARGLPADLTIVHNEVPHWVGTRLFRDDRLVAADIEDWHSEDLLPEDRAVRPLALIRAVERTLLHDACYTTTTSEALARALHQRYGGGVPTVISNSFPLQPDPHRGPAGDPPSFFWFSQTLGSGRGLELFIAAWSVTRAPSRLVLLGESAGSYRETLLRRIPAERRDRVSFLPLVSPAELPAVIARHDVGLALEQDFIVNRGLTVTNKILQYLNAGLAVIASDTAGQREVLGRSPDAGVIVKLTETAALARSLEELLADPTGLARRQAAARALAEAHYCWEKQSPVLLELVSRSLEE
jgi:glycosyltransferase involved in cell wall biosynthesis